MENIWVAWLICKFALLCFCFCHSHSHSHSHCLSFPHFSFNDLLQQSFVFLPPFQFQWPSAAVVCFLSPISVSITFCCSHLSSLPHFSFNYLLLQSFVFSPPFQFQLPSAAVICSWLLSFHSWWWSLHIDWNLVYWLWVMLTEFWSVNMLLIYLCRCRQWVQPPFLFFDAAFSVLFFFNLCFLLCWATDFL